MTQHRATISWRSKGEDFARGRYSREHTWTFDGGVVVPASPSPSVVRPPYSNPAAVDPEEAFVASISSCHMLTFLHLAAQQGFEVTAYDDEAVGTMTKNERGVMWLSAVALSPRIAYAGRAPTDDALHALHAQAHAQCFIANSIKTLVTVEAPKENR